MVNRAGQQGRGSRYARLALLKVEQAQGAQESLRVRVGSAYALTDNVLVTARHVWFGAAANDWIAQRGHVRLMHAAAETDWRAVEVCWHNAALDLCMLRLARAERFTGLGAAPNFGFYDRSAAVLWEGAGFPGAAVVPSHSGGRLREAADANGRLGPAGGMRQQLLALSVDAGPAQATDWGGMSGAPVFADGYLIGVVRGVLDSFEGRRLDASPLAPALELNEVRQLLGSTPVHQVPAGVLVLPKPNAVLPQDAPPSSVLHAKQRVLPFDRELHAHELRTISDWLDSTAAVRIELITGPGGAGKTRLLLELCEDRRRAGWHAGFLLSALSEDKRAQIAGDPRPALVCIDYAEVRPTLGAELERLLADMAGRAEPLRVLLIARAAADWWHALIERPAFRDLTLGSRPLALSSVALEGEARRRVVTRAVRAFAGVRAIDPAPALARLSAQDLSAPELGRVLYLQMLALAALDGLSLVPAELVDAMLAREAELWRKWQRTGDDDEQQAWLRALRRTIAVLTLQGGAPSRAQSLCLAAHAHGPINYERTVDLLRRLCPGTGEPESDRSYLDPLEPDLLGEALVHAVLSEEAENFIAEALAAAPIGNQRAAFTMLGRLSARDPGRVKPWIEMLLGVEPSTLLARSEPAFDAALSLAATTQGSDHLLGLVLSEHLSRAYPPKAPHPRAQDLADSMLARLPHQTLSLRELAVWAARTAARRASGESTAKVLGVLGNRLSAVGDREGALNATRRAVELFRQLAASRPNAFMSDLASSLNNLGIALSDVGDREGALNATREAVELRRQLAASRPDAFMPKLAGSLNNLGNQLSAVGDREGALSATRAALELFRQLAASRPDAFRPDLAMILCNLGSSLGDAGDQEGALNATREAVDLFRQLAASRPDAFMPDLTMTLNNLGYSLSAVGDREGALNATREAVDLRRQLAASRPDAFTPDLAMSLNNLGNQLSDVGDREGALNATREAVDLRRQLVASRPEAFMPDFAASLSALGNRLSAVGDREGALNATREAVELFRQLAASRPDVFMKDLASSLNNLGNRLSDARDREGALNATREAVELRRQLVASRLDACVPDLASSLNNLGSNLSAVGDRGGALSATREAVELYRQLAASRPDAFMQHLGGSLSNLGNSLSDAGDREGALNATREAVDLFRQLATSRPGAFMSELASSLNNLGNSLSDAGDREGALNATREAVDLFRRLASRWPQRFGPELSLSIMNLRKRLTSAGVDSNGDRLLAHAKATLAKCRLS